MKPLLFAFAVTIPACTAMQHDPVAIRAASLRSGICVLHHVPLREATVYEFAPVHVATLDPGMGTEVHDRYPNSLPVEYEFKKSEFNTKPVRYRYCPVCQQSYHRDLDEASKKAAEEWKREHHT